MCVYIYIHTYRLIFLGGFCLGAGKREASRWSGESARIESRGRGASRPRKGWGRVVNISFRAEILNQRHDFSKKARKYVSA